MASAESKITRKKVVAYARKTKGGGGGDSEPDEDGNSAKPPAGEEKAPDSAVVQVAAAESAPEPGEGPKGATPADAPVAEVVPPPAPVAEPAPASMFQRTKGETIAMPANLSMGSAPAMPVEEPPMVLPDPRNIPTGDPTAAAPPPGRVPSGMSRSFRRGTEFALVYRSTTFLVTRVGTVGTQGVWRVVEYPTSSSAGNAYAHECSRFVADGFSDYR